MRVFVFVNRIEEVGFRQTTALLAASFVRIGCDVYLANVDGLSFSSQNEEQKIEVSGVRIPPHENCDSNSVERVVKQTLHPETMQIVLEDLLLIRTNPGRDLDRSSLHTTFLDVCRSATIRGFSIVNDPSNLQYFASKASLLSLDPECYPRTLVSHNLEKVVEFVRSTEGDCVVKPLHGSRGQDVIRVNSQKTDLLGNLVNTFGKRAVVAQEFVDSNQPGDKRVVVLHGKILESGDAIGGIERRPAADDFRGNLHAGGTAHPLTLNEAERTTVEKAAKQLNEFGIDLAGIDLIGNRIIEFNVFSTGGLFDATEFAGFSFANEIANRLLEKHLRGASG